MLFWLPRHPHHAMRQACNKCAQHVLISQLAVDCRRGRAGGAAAEDAGPGRCRLRAVPARRARGRRQGAICHRLQNHLCHGRPISLPAMHHGTAAGL